jgi:glycosyltransferase involved in cell wall biosynthesis
MRNAGQNYEPSHPRVRPSGDGDDATRRPALSVVVLCYRSEDRIIPYVEQMEKELSEEGITDEELVLVGNYFPGSSDRTPDVVRELARKNPKIVPVTLAKQGMMGWDVMTGLAAARGEAVALIDGDGQMPSSDITRLYRILRSGEVDFAKTFRIKRFDGTYRRVISRCYNILFHLLFPGTPFRDINSKPKLIARRALEQMNLTCKGWFSDGEIMLEVQRLNLSFADVPTVFHENEWRASFVSVWTAFEILGYMLLYRLEYWFRRRRQAAQER